ncbi:hypothetical protein IPM65_07185 [Candidatus Roizmanbacteria bacterium]|nr:MAG: hypothetical protein IPM65_07185 [Candidatus Roizmanbacteria bacterium]
METLKPQVEYEPASRGMLLVMTGPSGAGKDTISNEVMRIPGFDAERIVTYASRDPRPGEVDGIDYNFVSLTQFEEMIAAGQFAEYFNYAEEGQPPDYKGTTREPFERVLAGENTIWRIDPSRAAQTDTFFEDNFSAEEAALLKERTLVVYVGVPALTTLYHRVRGRNPEEFAAKKEKFLQRLERDWSDWEKFGHLFEHVVMNDGTVEDAVQKVQELSR